eukprot:gene4006-5733_t
MKSIRLIAVIIGLVTQLFAVSAQSQVKVLVKGHVFDSLSSKPIQRATITFITAAGKVHPATADALGNFTLSLPATGKYMVSISVPGYYRKPQYLSMIAGINHVQLAMISKVELAREKKKAETAARREDYELGVAYEISPSPLQTNIAYNKGCFKAYSANDSQYYTENYHHIAENGYRDSKKEPLSTLSIDVDRASYSNMRRFLKQGQMPPADAVRVEELINYFPYNYAKPKGEHPFSITTDLTTCPWNTKHQLIRVGIQGKEIERNEMKRNNLVFLVDVSGSMSSSDKLPLLKAGLRLLVDQMKADDRIALVAYAGAAGLVLPPTDGRHKEQIIEALDRLESGGSTAGGEGIKLAYNVARELFLKDGNNRIVLATDGDFNVGASSEGELQRMIEKERESGVFLTVLGFGTGNLKDATMEISQKTLVNEMGGTMVAIASDVKIQIEFNPAKVKAYRLVGYENRLLNAEDFNDDKKDAGELGSGHNVTALYEIIPAGSSETVAGIDELKYQKNDVVASNGNEVMTIKFRYKEPGASTSKLIVSVLNAQEDLKHLSSMGEDFQFAAAVAEFGMLLRNSEYKGNTSYAEIRKMALAAKGKDENGYRAEFIQLVELAQMLDQRVGSKDKVE